MRVLTEFGIEFQKDTPILKKRFFHFFSSRDKTKRRGESGLKNLTVGKGEPYKVPVAYFFERVNENISTNWLCEWFLSEEKAIDTS